MRTRLRTLPPGQFGLFAVFMVLTVSAIAFAVMRLPLPWVAKMGPLSALLICFVGWAIRNRKYPNPSRPKKK
jgi:hypothetical protein